MAAGARGGADKLTGGGGSDRFVFAAGSGADEITDFTRGGGEADRIDLSAFDIAYEALRFTASSAGERWPASTPPTSARTRSPPCCGVDRKSTRLNSSH